MKPPFRADLHCHSTCSDGSFSPFEIIDLAVSSDLQGLSITDHDTIEAYATALPYAEKKGLPLISGIELSCVHKETSVHILGYAFSLSSPAMTTFCERHWKRRRERCHAIIERLEKIGLPINRESLPKKGIGRPHIALEMIKKKYVSSIEEAFRNFLGEGKPCYIPGEAFSVEESIDVIHQAKGLAVIAHPHLIKNTKIIKDLLSMPFDGIEGYYSLFRSPQEKPWIKIGLHRGWLITGGSDFHGAIKPQILLGSSWVNQETFNILKSHFANISL